MGERGNGSSVACACAIAVAVTLAAVLLAGPSPAGAAPPGARPAPVPPSLTHEGRWLVDPRGRVVVPHGMNIVAKRPPYSVRARGFDAEDARWLRREGFSAVRVGIIMTGLWPSPDGFSDAYLEDVAATIRTASRAGLWVLVDLHQDYFTESTGGEGFPGWMVHRRLPFAVPGIRADAAPFDAFWADDQGVQGVVAEAWRRIAARLGREQGLVGYDLFNEPFPGSREQECARPEGCPSFDRGVLAPFYRRVIAAIRTADPSSLVWYEPHVIFNQGAASSIGALRDPRAGFGFHVYCSERPTVPQPCAERRPQAFRNAEAQAARGRDALLLTEFGATDDTDELARVADAADAARVGWLHWAYWNEDPFAERPHEGLVRSLDVPPDRAGNVKEDKLAVLARPYPRVVAGTPSRWSWDRERRVFSVAWSTRRADGAGRFGPRTASELELPRAALPGRWTVQVRGGRVRGDKRARVLRVVARPGAEEVEVRVAAAG